MLVHLLTGARCHGIEIQPQLVEHASRCAQRWPPVTFECADAARAELDGSVFFLYSPFNGALLAKVLARLEQVAKRQPIEICAVDLSLEHVPWLRARETSSLALTIYSSTTGALGCTSTQSPRP
jgi:hypothetical protein